MDTKLSTMSNTICIQLSRGPYVMTLVPRPPRRYASCCTLGSFETPSASMQRGVVDGERELDLGEVERRGFRRREIFMTAIEDCLLAVATDGECCYTQLNDRIRQSFVA